VVLEVGIEIRTFGAVGSSERQAIIALLLDMTQ
jgi:hypothetical protein